MSPCGEAVELKSGEGDFFFFFLMSNLSLALGKVPALVSLLG